jgi:Arc/MetJ family transcription regulator
VTCPERTICFANVPRYAPEIKRTSLNLRLDLVAQAREILGTNGTTDTVNGALEEIVRRDKLRSLSEWTFEHLTDEELERLDWGLPLDGSPEPHP